MKTISGFSFLCVGLALGMLFHIWKYADKMSEDINAIRKTLAPFPISVEQPEMRQRVLLREDSHQEPEVTLL